MPESQEQAILAVEALTVDFPAVRALDSVSLAFRSGEVHGIIGENGAGKSTLMNVLSGLRKPTAGRILHRGRPAAFSGPAEAIRRGISMVHQELNLVDELSVADNIFLGRERSPLGFVKRGQTRRRAAELLGGIGSDIDPRAKVRTLPVAQQQMVEIAKALSCEAAVLILDEPTAVLSNREVGRLFELIGRLRERRVTVLYISHILPEVLEICDRISVLRDGRLVTTLDRAEAGAGKPAEVKLGSLMVGRPMADHFPPRGTPGQEVALRVEGLSAPPNVRDVSFDVRRGEILGFAGLVGAGRTEMAQAIFGLRPVATGRVEVCGRPLRAGSPGRARRAGLAYVSEDRKGRGVISGRSIRENTTLASLRKYSRGLIRFRRERLAAQSALARLNTKYGRLEGGIGTLSGGNQQKVILARWLDTSPRVLLLDEPTRGIDIGAKEEIYRLIAGLAGAGMACVLISSELNELLGMCHRVAVMRSGRIAGMVAGSEMTEERLMFLAAGVAGEAA